MRSLFALWLSVSSVLFVSTTADGQSPSLSPQNELQWLAFPDQSKFDVAGLHWFEENHPRLWRMPASVFESLPKGVQNRARCPSGGRIYLRSTTTTLTIRASAVDGSSLKTFDTYVDGRLCAASVAKKVGRESELMLFENINDQPKEIVIYLPHLQEVHVSAVGVDRTATVQPSNHRFAKPLPIVFYGSSVCQGSGAVHPGQTYTAILGRDCNLDFVNLGFGGAGKAEADVVELVNSIAACCYVFDLGKSYGAQDSTAFMNMLLKIRQSHSETPIIVITPITSIKEVQDADYSQRSIHTRAAMRVPVQELIGKGEKKLFLIEGQDLIGFHEHQSLSKDGVHPSDDGFGIIAEKLASTIRKAIEL